MKLREQKAITIGLKGENGHMRKKEEDLHRKIVEQNDNIATYEQREKELRDKKEKLDDIIRQHRAEIEKRGVEITKHETHIYDLKKENHELEKYKFVLDYQIKDLKKDIEPKDTEIANMKLSVAKMGQWLEEKHQENEKWNDTKAKLDESLKKKQKEILKQRTVHRRMRMELENLARGLHKLVRLIQDPTALRQGTIQLYRQHVPEHSIQAAEIDPDVAKEYKRQRQFLDKSVDVLKRKLGRDMKSRRNDNMRIMQDNVALIKEINNLRKEIKRMRQVQRHKDLHAVDGNGVGFGGTMDDGFDEKEALRAMERQREQIRRLRAAIDDAKQRMVNTRPISRERLPPIDDFSTPGATVHVHA